MEPCSRHFEVIVGHVEPLCIILHFRNKRAFVSVRGQVLLGFNLETDPHDAFEGQQLDGFDVVLLISSI